MLSAAATRRQTESDDARLVAGLQRGDEDAFLALVRRHQALMLRVARGYVRDERVAEQVVQETWMALLDGFERFEGRVSLKTWLFRLLVKRAITRAKQEGPPARLGPSATGDDDTGPTMDPGRFLDGEDPRSSGQWAAPPADWQAVPAERLLSRQTLDVVEEAVSQLPDRQRDVIVMRDVGGFRPDEVCAALDLSDPNQRVLLHRARATVRAQLARHLV